MDGDLKILNPEISVIIPAFNEEDRIGATVKKVASFLRGGDRSFEIIVVNDGSSDKTLLALSQIGNRDNLQIISYNANRGKGYAVREGMKIATGKYRLMMDADEAFDIENIDFFIKKCSEGANVVIGSIELPGSKIEKKTSFIRHLFGKASKTIIRHLVLPEIKDSQRGFKLFDAEAARIIFERQTLTGWAFDAELLVIARVHNISVIEVPITVKHFDNTSVSFFSYFVALADVIKIRRNMLGGKYL